MCGARERALLGRHSHIRSTIQPQHCSIIVLEVRGEVGLQQGQRQDGWLRAATATAAAGCCVQSVGALLLPHMHIPAMATTPACSPTGAVSPAATVTPAVATAAAAAVQRPPLFLLVGMVVVVVPQHLALVAQQHAHAADAQQEEEHREGAETSHGGGVVACHAFSSEWRAGRRAGSSTHPHDSKTQEVITLYQHSKVQYSTAQYSTII